MSATQPHTIDTYELFVQQLEFIRNGPILYRTDPELPEAISHKLRSISELGLPCPSLDLVLESYVRMNDNDPDVVNERATAIRDLSEKLQNDPNVRSYRERPSTSVMDKIVSTYEHIAPRSTILSCASIVDVRKKFLQHIPSNLDDVERKELSAVHSQIKSLTVNMVNIADAAIAIQEIIDKIESLTVAWIIVIAWTPERFTYTVKDQPAYNYDPVTTSIFFTGLERENYYVTNSAGYLKWWNRSVQYIETHAALYSAIFRSCFPMPDIDFDDKTQMDALRSVIELTGEIMAVYMHIADSEALIQTILPRLAHMMLDGYALSDEAFDMPFRRFLWRALPTVSTVSFSFMEKLARFVSFTARKAEEWAAPVGALNPILSLLYSIGLSFYQFMDKVIEVLGYGLEKVSTPLALFAQEYLFLGRAWASVVLPGARRRPKSVWALLFVNDFTRLTLGERFALSCRVMDISDPPSYEQWVTEFQKSINDTKLADYELFPAPPLRPLSLPKRPFSSDVELDALAPLFPSDGRWTDLLEEKIEKWKQYNVPHGIDQTWFGTPERIARSINRYDVDRVEPQEYEKTLMMRTAHALANKFPEMYKNHQYFTVAHAMKRLKWDTDMSPGLGFIGNVRRRRQLRQHGFLNAIQKVAEDRLQEGIHPGSVAWCFVKQDILSLQKLLDKYNEPGKNIRTVVAMALMSNVLALPFSIELSRAPPPEAFILNALPRSEGGYRPAFEAMKKRLLTLQADASEFDSKLGPVISVDGLSELRSIGFATNPAFPVISSQIRAHYHHMRHAALVDLTTGNVFRKTGGLMTGQVNTSYDNRDAFRLMIIAGWAHVTGRDPSEFWDDNDLGNAGDDDIIGTDQGLQLWLDVFKSIKDLFGVTVNLEETGWENLSITALQPVAEKPDTAYYRHQLGMPPVTYGIATEPAKLLLKKTNFSSRIAGLNDVPFRMAHVAVMVGTAYLTAYNNDIYNDLADLYIQDMKYIMLRFYQSVNITEHRDMFGNLTNITIDADKIRQRYANHAVRIADMFKKWQKTVKWPSYQKVFNIWVKPYSEATSNIAKHHRHLIAAGPALPVHDKLLWGLIGLRESLYMVPNHVVRALPEFQGADITAVLRTPDFIIECFVWRLLVIQRNTIPTKTAFLAALREGPYGAATAPVDFLEWLEVGDNMHNLLSTPVEALRGRVVLITAVYTYLETILKILAQMPVVGLAINIYALATRDVNRLYSVLNHLFWLAKGRSSPVISNMMPSDPYAWMKQLSVVLTNAVPGRFVAIPGLEHLVNWVPTIVEWWTIADHTVNPRFGARLPKALPENTPWDSVINDILVCQTNNVRTHGIIAPTGSGKSTVFIAALHRVFSNRRIWLVHPTRAARDEWDNSFMHSGSLQVLERGVERRPDVIVYSVTAGYFTQIPSLVLDSDIIVIDEAHMSQTAQWVVWYMSVNNLVFTLTATPSPGLQPDTQVVIKYPGTRRFKMSMTYTTQTFEALWQDLYTTSPRLLSRALIICPTLNRATYIRNTLDRMSIASSIMSRETPDVPPTGIIVATSIADQALTINPPPSVVIDTGEMLDVQLNNKLGSLIPTTTATIIPVSQEVALQRAGRGGRASDSSGYGIVTGPRSPHKPPMRTAVDLYLYPAVATNVMSALQIRNPLTVLHPFEGLLSFVTISADHNMNLNPDIIGMCYLLFLYFSALTSFEDAVIEILNYQHLDSQSDQLRVFLAQISACYPELQPTRGDPYLAQQYLQAGILSCKIGSTYWTTAALIVFNNWLVPAGHDLNMMVGVLSSIPYPSTARPIIERGIPDAVWSNTLNTMHVTGVVQSGAPSLPHTLALWTDSTDLLKPRDDIPATMYVAVNRIRRTLYTIFSSRRVVHVAIDGLGYVDDLPVLNLCFNTQGLALRHVTNIYLGDLKITIAGLLHLFIIVSSLGLSNQIFVLSPSGKGMVRPVTFNGLVVYGSTINDVVLAAPPTVMRQSFFAAMSNLANGCAYGLASTLNTYVVEDVIADVFTEAGLHTTRVTMFGDKLVFV